MFEKFFKKYVDKALADKLSEELKVKTLAGVSDHLSEKLAAEMGEFFTNEVMPEVKRELLTMKQPFVDSFVESVRNELQDRMKVTAEQIVDETIECLDYNHKEDLGNALANKAADVLTSRLDDLFKKA